VVGCAEASRRLAVLHSLGNHGSVLNFLPAIAVDTSRTVRRGIRIRRRGTGLAVAALLAMAICGCDAPCDRLADRLCAIRGVKSEQCAAWQTRAARVTPKTCEAALRMLDRERIR